MTFNNSILLILKQYKSIEFNELLSKISSRYTNSSSAYSALSRALKNLDSLGQVKRKDSRIFITDKGLASIHVEMKEKLVLKLNEAFKKPLINLEEIVQLLIVLSERASESNDLLQGAKEYAEFTIEDISALQDAITEQQEFIEKMRSLLGVQEERFRELDFNDCLELVFDKKFVEKASSFVNDKIIVKTNDKDLLEKIPEVWQKDASIIVDKEFSKNLFDILLDNSLSEFTIYLENIKCVASKGMVNCYSSHKLLNEFNKK
jgi:hypothetical protein